MDTMGGSDRTAEAKRDLVAETLLDWSVAADGDSCVLNLLSQEGAEVALTFPARALPRALMVLLDLLTALQRQNSASPTDVVHLVGTWRVEQLRDEAQRLLTLTTTEGFSPTFLLGQDALEAIARAGIQPAATKGQTTH